MAFARYKDEDAMDLVSIIVPCYNQMKFLPRCLDSLIGQTYRNIEILCVNDASTDATLNVINDYRLQDDRIKIVDIRHGGLGWARNCGIERASGKYLMFCDSDDEFMPDACYQLYSAIHDNDCDVAMCSAKVVYESDLHMKASDDAYYTLKFSGLYEDRHKILNNVDVCVWNKIFKKSLIDKYNIKFIEGRLYEDASFTWKYFSIAKKFYCINDAFYIYYRHEGTIMNKTFAKANKSIDHIYVADNVYEFLVGNNLFEEFMHEFFSFYNSNASLARKYSDEKGMDDIDALHDELQIKYLPWMKYEEARKQAKRREKVLSNLRSRIKSA